MILSPVGMMIYENNIQAQENADFSVQERAVELASEEWVQGIIRQELEAVRMEAESMSDWERIVYLEDMLEHWENRKHAAFSHFLIKMNQEEDSERNATWARCADTLLETPFHQTKNEFVDSIYAARTHQKAALVEGNVPEAQLFAVLKAALEYNRTQLPGEASTNESEKVRLKATYIELRDSLLVA